MFVEFIDRRMIEDFLRRMMQEHPKDYDTIRKIEKCLYPYKKSRI